MRLLIALLFISICISISTNSVLAGRIEAESATCLIRVEGPGNEYQLGSGGAIETRDSDVFILTCRHIFENIRVKRIMCQFYTGSPREIWVEAQISKLGQINREDLAILHIPRSSFNGKVPHKIPLAKYSPRRGDRIITNGYPEGQGPFVFGATLKGFWNVRLAFDRVPAVGRSGSLILDENADEIVGVLTEQDPPEGLGYGPNLRTIYNFLNLNPPRNQIRDTSFGPEPKGVVCPGGSCNPFQQFQPFQSQRPFQQYIQPQSRQLSPHLSPHLSPPLSPQSSQQPRFQDELPGWEKPGEPAEPLEPVTQPVIESEPSGATLEDLLALQQEVTDLKRQLVELQLTPPLQPLQGKQGETGDQGPVGPAGPQGPAGVLVVEYLDGNGQVAKREEVKDGILRLPSQRLRVFDVDAGTYKDSTAVLGKPMGIHSRAIE